MKAFLYLQKNFGWKELSLDLPAGTTLSALFRILRQSRGFPDWIPAGNSVRLLLDGGKSLSLTVLINGRLIRTLQGVETILEDGATVTLFPPSAGG